MVDPYNVALYEIRRFEDRVVTFRQETEGLREVIITKHEQIIRLKEQIICLNRNARLLVALKDIIRLELGENYKGSTPEQIETMARARAAIAAEEKEQSK